MRTTIAALTTLLFTFSLHAQLGDILRRVDPNKIRKGAKVMHDATREFTDDEEKDIGRVVAARILATYPLSKNDKVQRYVTLVGNTVAAYSARPTLGWHFAVLDTPVVNAFSCPGGFIFITTGALEQMHSEAELAAVLGHEVGHATQKHILKEIRRNSVFMSSVDLAGEASFGNSLTDAVGEKLGAIAYEKLFTSGLSRRDENEADKIGVELAAEAGYRSSEFLRFLEGLQKLEGSSQMKVLVATHPRAADRITVVKPLVAKSDQGVILDDRWKSWTQLSAR
jgi:beta-barrel assembly-enhancing protease